VKHFAGHGTQRRALRLPGRLKKIVDYVRDNSTFGNLAIASMRLRLKEDVAAITLATPDDPQREQRYLDAAREVMNREHLDIPF